MPNHLFNKFTNLTQIGIRKNKKKIFEEIYCRNVPILQILSENI